MVPTVVHDLEKHCMQPSMCSQEALMVLQQPTQIEPTVEILMSSKSLQRRFSLKQLWSACTSSIGLMSHLCLNAALPIACLRCCSRSVVLY